MPPCVKNTVWPSDIDAAIAALQQDPPPASHLQRPTLTIHTIQHTARNIQCYPYPHSAYTPY